MHVVLRDDSLPVAKTCAAYSSSVIQWRREGTWATAQPTDTTSVLPEEGAAR